MGFYSCSKKPEECPYRFDYRGCKIENCKYPEEFKKMQGKKQIEEKCKVILQ